MEITHHQHNCDTQTTILFREARNGLCSLVLQYALHQTRIAAMHPQRGCATEWATWMYLGGNRRDGKYFVNYLDIGHF